jgi:hypothetical protein
MGELAEALISYKEIKNRFLDWIPDSYLLGLSDYSFVNN